MSSRVPSRRQKKKKPLLRLSPSKSKQGQENGAGRKHHVQRGIYSEYLGKTNDSFLQDATKGPREVTVPMQPSPKASSFRHSGRTTRAVVVSQRQRPHDPLEPKIIAPYRPRAGGPPRRIAVERKKRLFAKQDIEVLLRKQGVDYQKYAVSVNHTNGMPAYLPLELFDDTEYHTRSPEEWVALGSARTGKCRVPGKGLRVADGKGRFVKCVMTGWNAKDRLYEVVWADTKKGDTLHPIHLLLNMDDPFLFAKRVAKAHQSRADFESSIRYSLYVDSMPTDEIELLDSEQVNRIRFLALNTNARRADQDLDLTSLLNEVNIDYQRTMNKIIFDVYLTDPTQDALRSHLQLQPSNPMFQSLVSSSEPEPLLLDAPPNFKGVVDTAPHDFPNMFSDFCFFSFFTKPEAISAMVAVNKECLKVRDMGLFNVKVMAPQSRSLKLEEFEHHQGAALAVLDHYLKDNWISSVQEAITMSLAAVGKGWFNLKEKNREVYLFSKLRKFLTLCNFLMKDSLRYLVAESLHSYCRLLEDASAYEVKVADTNDVEVMRAPFEPAQSTASISIQQADAANAKASQSDNSAGTSNALFTVQLTTKDGKIQFKKSPQEFVESCLRAFDTALHTIQGIPQIETRVMKHLFLYGNETKIQSIMRKERVDIDLDDNEDADELLEEMDPDPWVQDMYERLGDSLRRAFANMDRYLVKFEPFSAFVQLDVDAYVAEFIGDDEVTNEDMKEEIAKHEKAIAELQDRIPKEIWLGIVEVNGEEVQRRLISKHQQIVHKLLDQFALRTKRVCQDIGLAFKDIQMKLRGEPLNIEELTQMTDYIQTVHMTVVNQKPRLTEAADSFRLLESFHYKYRKDLFDLKWETFAWPKTIHDITEARTQALNKEKERFLQQMRSEQEEYNVELERVRREVEAFGTRGDGALENDDTLEAIHKSAVEVQERLSSLEKRGNEFNQSETLFGENVSDYKHVTKLRKEFEPYMSLWTAVYTWREKHRQWITQPFFTIDATECEETTIKCGKTVSQCSNKRAIKSNATLYALARQIHEEVEEFKPRLPLVEALRNQGMQTRHWQNLAEDLGIALSPDDRKMTLTSMVNDLKLDQPDKLESIVKVADVASREFQIEQALEKMEAQWKGMELTLVPYKETRTYVVKDIDDVIMPTLDEHIVTTQAMTFSPYKKNFEQRITDWDKKLRLVSDVLEMWLKVQRQWLSLQPIFTSDDIKKQLPAEGKKFESVNKMWRLSMNNAHNNPEVLRVCDDNRFLKKLTEANQALDEVGKRLSDYLDRKRASFARFYFLSNEELLQILSQTRDPTAVQPHLKKCFENVDLLEFRDMPDHPNVITALFSSKKERIDFQKHVYTSGCNVEHWMGQVEDEMKNSVKHVLNKAIEDYVDRPRSEWVLEWPAQCVLNGSQLHWTKEVETVIKEQGAQGVKQYYEKLKAQLLNMVEIVRGDLTKVQSSTMGALIVLDVHARDVVERLAKEGVSNITDFAWICQMRYYRDADDGSLFVRMVQSRFPYGYEYLGNSGRLVITPLTDRCYMTLMGALQLHLGGAPAGPAGTGKTETVKDLAKAVAIQCVVFNCSDGLDYLAMGKFFKGLASSGAWACFDEFNRIDIEVLSVVAQQIMTIQHAVIQGLTDFIFEDTHLALNPTCSVFITMNPGYAGRTELPDNLKALFRPVAMMVPDYALIAEIILYSYGFTNARALAQKIVATFTLCSEQLSSQDHYDYGMRAVKTVIVRAGILKREDSKGDEALLVLRALRDVNVPKFLEHDLPLFEGIVSDLFPGVKRPEIDYGVLMNSIIMATREHGLQPAQSFLDKCVQLYETTVVRHGLMLVGPTGGGKTSNLRVVKAAIDRLHQLDDFYHVEVHTLNPKSVTMGQLYGQFDENTHEWTDGILANVVRQCIEDKRSPAVKHWVVFDGPVDAIWIENMNTVLDDNKKLCLVSGEILQITDMMNMVFEVEDLAVASPATVSRCGMVYMQPSALGLSPLVQSYIESVGIKNDEVNRQLLHYFDTFLAPCLHFVRKRCHEPVPSVDNNLAQSCMRLLSTLLKPFLQGASADEEKENLGLLLHIIEPLFVFSIVWSVGATTNKEGRRLFDTFFRLLLRDNDIKNVPPEDGTLFDYVFDAKMEAWRKWMDTQPTFTVNLNLPYSDIVVPTTDSVRYTFLLDALMKSNVHVLFTGDTGTGKSVNVEQWLRHMPSQYSPVNIIFSAATSANQTQDLLFSHLEKRRKAIYGPPLGKRYVVFVDDMNMPAQEEYFAQPPIELLRQWMDHEGWYDRQSLEFYQVIDVSFVGAMGPPGGGRNPVTPRFLRHFNQVAHTELETDSLFSIFSTILTGFLAKFDDDISKLAGATASATIEAYQTIRRELLPTPSKSHYTFNLRDLSKVFQGVLSVDRRLKDPDAFLRLWVHETRRVFSDRLINDQDRTWIDQLMGRMMSQHFERKWDDVVPKERVLFGHYGQDDGQYREVSELKSAVKAMKESLEAYAEEETPLNLVLFQDAVEHVSRISRIIRQPQGNALLLGVGGSGRQSLTKLAVYMAEYKLARIEVTKNFGVTEWREYLKELLLSVALKEEPTVFLFSDTQIVHETFLEDVNNILNSGDVPALRQLYSNEEEAEIFRVGKIDCQQRGIPVTPQNMYAQYIKRVRRNLHVVLTMSPLSEVFRTRLRMFPALVNCCTIDWFSAWPSEALFSVARASLNKQDLKLGDTIDSVVHMFEHIHLSVEEASKEYLDELRRHNHVTPTSFLELLSVFKTLLLEKRQNVGGMRSKLQNGLTTLKDAEKKVAQLEIDLKAKQPVLKKEQLAVEESKKEITEQSKIADAQKEIVEKQEAEAEAKAAECRGMSKQADDELAEALPALDAAVECLKELKANDFVEVNSMTNPPRGVRITMEAACIMLRKKPVMKTDPNNQYGKKIPDYWDTAKKELLKDARGLISILQNYDRDNIPASVIKKIEPYIKNKDFAVENVEKASKACKAIAMWTHAMFKFYNVSLLVEPLRKKSAEAKEQLDVQMAALKEAKDRFSEVTRRIDSLTQSYEAAVSKAERLKWEVEDCAEKIIRATKLTGGLAGEKIRWGSTVKELDKDYENLLGDVLVSAGTIAYLGPFVSAYRNKITEQWRQKLRFLGIPHTENCDIRMTLADPVAVRDWTIKYSLPADNFSVENSIIMHKGRRWPLMIDPQGQAAKFVKKMGDARFPEGTAVVKLSDKNFQTTLENCLRFGKWILVADVLEELDPLLEPLLSKQTIMVNRQPHVRVGDKNIPYDDKFRLYITTKLPNPHYSPELQVKVTLLNFTITPGGLEDQMLGVVVAKENPEMEANKNALVEQNAKMKTALKNIEDEILRLLNDTQGDPLEDDNLINTLETSKKTSKDIEEKVKDAAIVEADIDEKRKAYRPVAKRASILYFAISDLSTVDPMYQYSLQWFVNLFTDAIEHAPHGDSLAARLTHLNDYFTLSLYENVCRSIFEKHKTLFAFLLAVKILQGNGAVDPAEWRFMVAGGGTDVKDKPNPAPEWLVASSWAQILALDDLPAFKGFVADFCKPPNLKVWKSIFDSLEPQKQRLPSPWDSKLTSFQKIIVLKCIRPDKVIPAVTMFVEEKLGPKFTESPQFDIRYSFQTSSPAIPLIFILSRGADPASELATFASQEGFRDDKFVSISLGQGQGPLAEEAMRRAMENGGWVLLQNCHLAVSWLPTLERICNEVNEDEVAPTYRLWLTSMPTKKFPVSILQDGVKMINEPPKGLKANLKRSYLGFDDEFLNDVKNPSAFKRLLFGLCFFHAIILDRRKFGPLGWNIPYDFTENDLHVCITQLREFVDMYDDIPYEVIHFLTYGINYGGRVTDDKDRRTICAILDTYITPDLMKPDYSFSESGKYRPLEAKTQAEYLKYIQEMDSTPEPEVFGLHENANISSAQEATMTLFSTILQMLPRSGGGAGQKMEDVVHDAATHMLEQLPPVFDIEMVRKKFPTTYEESMNTVVVQEAGRYNRLVSTMKKTLRDLLKALKGEMVMTKVLEDMSAALFNNTVPANWASVAYPSLKPLGAWMDDLLKRLAFIQDWIDNGTPKVFWISGFFFPQAFLTGTLQNFARKHVKPIDTVSFGFEVVDTPLDEIKEQPQDGIYVHGLFLEGALWDPASHSLVDSRPKDLYTTMPVMWFKPEIDRVTPTTGVYRCPVYKTLTRRGTLSTTGHSTNFVLYVEIPTKEPDKKWIKAGVALFTALRY